MRLQHFEEGSIAIYLSKRNLLALLHKVDMEGSARTIESFCAYNPDGSAVNTYFTVMAEPDELHYKDRPAPFVGGMIPETEKFIAENSDKVFDYNE